MNEREFISAAGAGRQDDQGICEHERAAIELLLKRAAKMNGAADKIRSFLLAWHNPRKHGGWCPTDLFCLDEQNASAILVVIGLLARRPGTYLSEIGYADKIAALEQ